MNIIGNCVIDGVPYINGKPAKKCEEKDCCMCQSTAMKEALSEWLCPECGAHLGKTSLICLNACHLSAAAFRRFQNGLADATATVKRREETEKIIRGKLDRK